jgi:hypothetical protein
MKHTNSEEPAMIDPSRADPCKTARQSWSKHREASLNWLALGLLLAAWNASDNETKVPSPTANFAKGHKTVNEL